MPISQTATQLARKLDRQEEVAADVLALATELREEMTAAGYSSGIIDIGVGKYLVALPGWAARYPVGDFHKIINVIS